jgi:hypothetical protein
MSKETFTRENLIDHLERLAYHGVGAVVGIGDLVDRMKPGGGRTGWGDVPLRLRDEVIPGAALFKTAGAGMAYPGAGAQGHASRADVMYEVTTPEEVRAAVEDYARMKPEFIKIWVDDREGRKPTLPPALYRVIVEEADNSHSRSASTTPSSWTPRADACRRRGLAAHAGARGRFRGRRDPRHGQGSIARNFHPTMWVTPGLQSAWMNSQACDAGLARRSAAEGDLLRQQIKEYWATRWRS